MEEVAKVIESRSRHAQPAPQPNWGCQRGPSTKKSSAWESINIGSKSQRLADQNRGNPVIDCFPQHTFWRKTNRIRRLYSKPSTRCLIRVTTPKRSVTGPRITFNTAHTSSQAAMV